MSDSQETTERKSFSKKERFEVFKRDNFTCQYCGREAPDVILELDHIKPLAEGGSNDITNLITSCFDCNRGKGPRELSDHSEIKKQKDELDKLNERRKQLEMLSEWRRELLDLKEEKVDTLARHWDQLTGDQYSLNESGKNGIRGLLNDYSVEQIIEAMDTARDQYFEWKDDELTHDSVELAFDKIQGICYLNEKSKENPDIGEIYYIRGILRNRLNYFDKNKALGYLKEAYNTEISLDKLQDLATTCRNWTDFKDTITSWIREAENE